VLGDTRSGQQAALVGGRVPDDQGDDDSDEHQESRQFLGHLELVGMDRRRRVVLKPLLWKLPRNSIGTGLLAAIVGAVAGMLPGVLGDDLGTERPIKVNVLTSELAYVMVQKRGRLADKNQIVTAVPVDFHLP